MRYLTFLFSLLLILNAEEVHASEARVNPLTGYIKSNQRIQSLGLQSILTKRCTSYLGLIEIPQCIDAVNQMIRLMDFKIKFLETSDQDNNWKNQSFVAIAFKKETTQWLNNASLTNLLLFINDKLFEAATTGVTDFNLWEQLVTSTHNNEVTALTMMASLFQDTTYGQAHLEYLRKEDIYRSDVFKRNLDLLSNVIDHLTNIYDSYPGIYRQIVFQKNLASKLSPSPYHFYVPKYLASKLKKLGFSDRISRIAPLILTISYEFATIESDDTYIFRDPKNLDPKTSSWKINDILTGYIGAREGVGTKNHTSVESLGQGFSLSTKNAIEILLK